MRNLNQVETQKIGAGSITLYVAVGGALILAPGVVLYTAEKAVQLGYYTAYAACYYSYQLGKYVYRSI